MLGILGLQLGAGVALALQDDPICKDHPLFSRMPHFFLTSVANCQEIAFDSHRFSMNKNEQVSIEGRKLDLTYRFDTDLKQPHPSPLQIARNYTNAIERIGGKVLVSFDNDYRTTVMRVSKDNKEIWAQVEAQNEGAMINLVIVEKEKMKQDVVANAEALASDLKATGKVAVYGIYFDTGKAEIKPESDAAMTEIAKLIKQEKNLKIHIVGHTDNTGNFDANMKLSQARAEAVMKALISRHKIDAGRLNAHGVSSLAPVATNTSEDGKAKNRRVELVAQ